MDTSGQAIVGTVKRMKWQGRSLGEKLRIVEEILETGASVAVVARLHGMNAYCSDEVDHKHNRT